MADTADVRYDSFNVLICNTITQIRSRKHRADYDTIYENISKNSASNINKEFIIERIDDLLKNGKIINKVTAKGLNSFFCNEIRINVSDQDDSSESSETEKCNEPKAIIVETPNGELGTTLYTKDNENMLNAQFMTLKSFVINEIDSLKLQSGATNYVNKVSESSKSSGGDIDMINILSEQIIFLKEENENKNIIIKTLLENQKILIQDEKNAKNVKNIKNMKQFPVEDEFIYPKRRNKEVLNLNRVSNKFKSNWQLPLQNHFSSLNLNDDINSTESDNDTNDVTSTKRVTNKTKTKRRPSPVINQFPENEKSFVNRRRLSNRKTIIPIEKDDSRLKTTTILSDSIPKRFNMKDFNESMNDGRTYLKSFPGAKASHLKHYALPTLRENKPDMIIIHVGYNDLCTRDEVDVNKVAKEIIDVAKTCIDHDVSTVYISSIICNRNYKKQQLIDKVNERLKQECEHENFIFIENSNIEKKHLWKDGTHLNEIGKTILSNNFIDYLNNYTFLYQTPFQNRVP